MRVHACAVCRTDLHVVDGELTQPKLPLVPGHEIVGRLQNLAKAQGVSKSVIGSAFPGWVGLMATCRFCRSHARIFVKMRASPDIPSTVAMRNTRWRTNAFAFPSRRVTPISEAAPLLCAGSDWLSFTT